MLFSAKYPQWIPYAIIGSTGVSLPLVALVKEEYNRSAFDSEDTTPENEVNQDIIDDENVENSWTTELNLMTNYFRKNNLKLKKGT